MTIIFRLILFDSVNESIWFANKSDCSIPQQLVGELSVLGNVDLTVKLIGLIYSNHESGMNRIKIIFGKSECTTSLYLLMLMLWGNLASIYWHHLAERAALFSYYQFLPYDP